MQQHFVPSDPVLIAQLLCAKVRDLYHSVPANRHCQEILKDVTATFVCRAQILCDVVACSIGDSSLYFETLNSFLLLLLEAVEHATDQQYRLITSPEARLAGRFDEMIQNLQHVRKAVRHRFEDIWIHMHDLRDQRFRTRAQHSTVIDPLHRSFLNLRYTKPIRNEVVKGVASISIQRQSEDGQQMCARLADRITLTMSATADKFVSCGANGHLCIHRVSPYEGDKTHKVSGLTGNISVAFTPKGDVFAAFSHTSTVLRLLNAATGELLRSLEGHNTPVRGAEWSPDGTALATFDEGGRVILWSTLESSTPQFSFETTSAKICALVWCIHYGKLLLNVVKVDGNLYVPRYTNTDTREKWRETGWPDSHFLTYLKNSVEVSIEASVACVARPNMLKNTYNQGFAVGCADSTVRLVPGNASKSEEIVLRGHEEKVIALRFSPDGRMLASCSTDSTTRIWQGRGYYPYQMTCMHVLKHGSASITCVAWSGDSCRVATGSDKGTVRVWSVATGDVESNFRLQGGAVSSVAFSGSNLFASTRNEVRAFRVRVGAV